MRSLSKKRSLIRLMVFIFVFTLCSSGLSLAANDALIRDIKLTNNRDFLITYFKIDGAFTDEISEAVLKGVSTSFLFHISLYKTKEGWFDKKLSGLKLTSTLKYNTMKKQFAVSRPWKEKDPFVTESFEKAKKAMTEINNLRVVSLDNLKKGEKYQIRLKAELDRITLPLYLHYVFFFVSFWNFETDWYIINFTY